MKNTFFLLLWFIPSLPLFAQFNPVNNPMVYHEPAMDKVTVQKGLVYKTVNQDTVLTFDVYYPPKYSKKTPLPVVVFASGIMQIPSWQIYKDWASLVAAHGMIAITYQGRFEKGIQDMNDLLAQVQKQAGELKVDPNKVAIWACSANGQIGWPTANNPTNELIKAVAIYYGVIPAQERMVNRKNLEILLVRAGLDSYSLNQGMDELMANALKSDTHVEFINYPQGQHAFDGVDNTPRSKEIILQTIDFFKRNLLGNNGDADISLITNQQFWKAILDGKQVDDAINQFKTAYNFYKSKPEHAFFNQLLKENNLNTLGYQLLGVNRADDAIKIFALGIELFPQSPNAFDALADAYEKKGDKENTLRYAQLALEKLKTATNLPPPFARAIKESAETKINIAQNEYKAPYKRAHHELVYDEDGKSVLLVGGSTPLNGGQSFKFFNDIWRYTNEGWSKVGNSGDERSGIRMAYDTRRKKLYSFGGFTPDNQSSAQLRVLENGAWKIVTDLPEMKAAEPGFVYDEARDRLIVFGGSASHNQLNHTTWEWDGTQWNKFAGESPAARQAFVMAYDTRRKRTVLFGGMGAAQQMFGDTWEFNGKKWTKVSDSGPGTRITAGYAYDTKRGMLVIFGGMVDGQIKNDTWGWNGKEWKKLADAGPSPRMMGYMAYDKARDRMVLFGGRLGWPTDTDDTWEWDGSKWEAKKPHSVE
jgi:dienelactone hydrolase